MESFIAFSANSSVVRGTFCTCSTHTVCASARVDLARRAGQMKAFRAASADRRAILGALSPCSGFSIRASAFVGLTRVVEAHVETFIAA